MKRALILTLAVALALAVCALWIWESAKKAPDRVPQEALVLPESPRNLAASDSSSPKLDRTAAAESNARTFAKDEASRAWTPSAADLVDAQWVEGRVTLPAGVPVDEHATIEARGRAFRGGGRHSVALGPDGSFRVAFSKDTKSGTLHLDARYLCIDDPKLKLPYSGEPVVLEAALGGVVRGTIALSPIGEKHRHELAGAKVSFWSQSRSNDSKHSGQGPVAVVGEDARFEACAFPCASDWLFTLQADGFADIKEANITVEGGKVLDLSLATTLCARLTGKVTDESGNAVQGASFEYSGAENVANPFRKLRSGADGTFELRNVPLGTGKLLTSCADWLTVTTPLPNRSEGQIVDGLTIVLTRGNSLVGKVSWPDGRPAPTAEVQAFFIEAPIPGESKVEKFRHPRVKCDEQGRFRIGAVSHSPVRLIVSAPAPESGGPRTDTKQTSMDAGQSSWNALLELDAPGTDELALVLSPPCSIHGRVLDTSGNPQQGFNVSATPIWRVRASVESWTEGRDKFINSPDGSFVLSGLSQGSWEVTAYAVTAPRSTPRRVELPGTGESVELVLARSCRVSGVVLDPHGAPVEAATVSCGTSGGHTARSDSAGHFVLEYVAAGSVSLQAEATGWARSKPVLVDVSAGEAVAGAQLELRVPGKIVGQVLDAEGHPARGRRIWAQGDEVSLQALSDDRGRFTFEDLPAGQYRLESTAAEKDVAHVATVTLEEGHTANVTLGGRLDREGTILVQGHVRCAGKPVANCDVGAYLLSEDARGDFASTTTTEDGGFRLPVAGSGSFLFTLKPRRGPRTDVRRAIAKASNAELEFELPSGRIEGRVVDHAGRSVGEMRLSLEADRSAGSLQLSVPDHSGRSDAQGRFAFEYVPAGTYAISSDGEFNFSHRQRYGRTIRGGYVVREGSTLADVVFELLPACRIEGLVRGAANVPVSQARIFARDDSGRTLGETYEADSGGQFTIDGLPPGRFSFFAQTDSCASQESPLLTVDENKVVRIDLALEQGTKLYVQLLDAAGNPAHSFIEILDARGFDLSHVLRWVSPDPPTPPPGEKLGPLAPGKYTLRCRPLGKREITQELRLTGEPVLGVTLRTTD